MSVQTFTETRLILEKWEEEFCLPYYRGEWQDVNTVYLDTQKFYSRCCKHGAAQDLEGVYATSCGTPWAGLNLAFVAQPIRRLEWFRPRLERALHFYRSLDLPWMLVVPERWVAPGQHVVLETYLRDSGFQLAMEATATLADRLNPLGQAPITIEPAQNPETWAAITSINAASWNVPIEWVEPLLGSAQFQEHARGWLGRMDGNPACTMVTFSSLPYTFFCWGATLPEYRKRGFGAHIIRYSSEHSGSNQPLLCISSPQALKTWVEAGFKESERLRLYMAPSQ